ncbi:hypothetical protein A3I45_03725 [Candidatus Uhrbacteria bacterium RIFCSPLOWO2_02_FULL_53_10]|nr:MAG: hypothetical protein A3I45_03725 [Candidatus Uhrbacteria bacterium RIFCSPLOWO2_02_FULL_53_10]
MGNRRRVDSEPVHELFAEDIVIEPTEWPDRLRRRYDAEDLLEKAEREQELGGLRAQDSKDAQGDQHRPSRAA